MAPPSPGPGVAAPPSPIGTAAVRQRRIAILGNPNTGKSTLFNALTGLKARVANYPGVTVEKKVGPLAPGVDLIDLPGTYSLAAHSPDELVAVKVLHGDLAGEGEPRPDLVVLIADASNLPRNLFLVTQVMEMGLPVVVALNMVDAAERTGIKVDAAKLALALGVPVIPTIASKSEGIAELRALLIAPALPTPPRRMWNLPAAMETEIATLAEQYGRDRFEAARALIDEGGALEAHLSALQPLMDGATRLGGAAPATFGAAVQAARLRLTQGGVTPAKAEVQMRYGWIAAVAQPCIQRTAAEAGADATDRIDNWLTHRLFGSLIFIALMTLVFISIFLLAQPFMQWIDAGFGWLGHVAEAAFAGSSLEGGMLESMVIDGAIPGVGGVFVFLPQIAFLFMFVAILEDSGYMARAAFLMDRVLRFCGLSGHSFIPMMSSFACAIPGLMATRTIANPRDRLTTILIAPLMSCSARIPVYGLLCAAFVPRQPLHGMLPGLVFAAMYFVGIGTAVPVAWLLKKTLLKGPPPPFVLELPQYRVPIWSNVGLRVWEASKAFTIRAGTAIFAISLILWALLYFPHASRIAEKFDAQRTEVTTKLPEGPEREDALAKVDHLEKGEYLRDSLLGRLGHGIEPAVMPLGWDWRIGIAALASFPAREVVVSTLRIIYDLGADEDDEAAGQEKLAQQLQASTWPDGRKVFTLPVALSIMVFFALCAQCAATLVTIKKESGSWKWAAFTFVYMTGLAYVGAFITYQVGTALMAQL
ncbi:MAG TPA: ferrous iron transport protein B [Planctomycetota bacterium]|nr:ferrous iron transport protein B [Planctomycetota bacterium]